MIEVLYLMCGTDVERLTFRKSFFDINQHDFVSHLAVSQHIGTRCAHITSANYSYFHKNIDLSFICRLLITAGREGCRMDKVFKISTF